jgi:hypothetical protein
MTKSKVHTIYKLKDGTRVPSVTTILGILGKPALIHWAWKCGCDGLDYQKVRDDAAEVGTVAHAFIMEYLTNQNSTFDAAEYAPNVLERAKACVEKFKNWQAEHSTFKLILAEQQLVSEGYKFGGTIDCLASLNDKLVLIDFKTGNAIYDEMRYQLAAYMQLLKENGHDVSHARLLRIGRDETEGFEDKPFVNLVKEWQIFLHCRGIYDLQKKTSSTE